VVISPTWVDAPLEPIATKLGNSFYLTELINRSKFSVDWYSSFGFGEVQNLPFPMGTTSGPYHCSTTALAPDTVILAVVAMFLVMPFFGGWNNGGAYCGQYVHFDMHFLKQGMTERWPGHNGKQQ